MYPFVMLFLSALFDIQYHNETDQCFVCYIWLNVFIENMA